MLNNYKNRDTLEVFNDRWKANHNIVKKPIKNTPSSMAKNISNNINKVKINNREDLVNKLRGIK